MPDQVRHDGEYKQVRHDGEYKYEEIRSVKFLHDQADFVDSLHGVGYQVSMKNSGTHSVVVIITIH